MGNLPLLKVEGVSKSFSGVCVLDEVSFSLERGDVHAIVGENGAGKSTLIKILSGAYTRDSGNVTIDTIEVSALSPKTAQNLGIVTIYQERNLLPLLSVAENILLGDVHVSRLGFVQWEKIYQQARDILENLNIDLNPKSSVGTLSPAEQQAVEIAKALHKNVKIVIMDEPTASLTKKEIDNLFELIVTLKEKGVAVIYISHRLDEVFEIADSVMVLRDGKKVLETNIGNINKAELVKAMVGKELRFTEIDTSDFTGQILLEARDITRSGFFRNIDLTLHRGEIIGVSGMVGSGRTSVVEAMAGVGKIESGCILFKNQEIHGKDLTYFINQGIASMPEDRDNVGLIAQMSVAGNTTLASIQRLSPGMVLNLPEEKRITEEFVDTLGINTKSIFQEVQYLSGGNRQKVMISKWLCRGFDVFIMDEPSQGVDVGAREEIHQIMKKLVSEGKGIIMVSSDLDELLHMSNRIIVMNNGRIAARLTTQHTSREEVVSYAIRKFEN